MTETIEREATAPVVKSDTPVMSHQPPKLLDQVRDRIRVKHYSLSTEKTYLYWIRFFIRHAGMRHPRDMGAAEVEAFLSYLATQREVSAGTQNQAMHAILFLYRDVLGITMPWLDGITRAKPSKRLTALLSRQFARIFAAAGCPDLRFHDLRHEATSRLFEKTALSEFEIAKITGHRSPRMLMRYANLRASDLAGKMW